MKDQFFDDLLSGIGPLRLFQSVVREVFIIFFRQKAVHLIDEFTVPEEHVLIRFIT